jgi:hypothetical protein
MFYNFSIKNIKLFYTGTKARINHYIIRSLQDCCEVKMQIYNHKNCGYYFDNLKNQDRNDIYDDNISKRFGHILKYKRRSKKIIKY